MIMLLSGEGPSDIGYCRAAVSPCCGEQFQSGPMAVIVDQFVEQKCGYSLLETGAVCFVSEHCLIEYGKSISVRHSPRLPGVKAEKDTGFFRKNAQALGSMAKEMEVRREYPVVAVLFRDSDGSNSSTRSLWDKKFDSIVLGFQQAGFDRGVPMVPKPKSEAWLLCALKENPYQHCASLEDESGNDASPNSLKKQLNDVDNHAPIDELTEWIRN